VTSENLARGSERMGVNERKGTAYLADAATPEALHAAWKEARVAIRHQADVEKGVVRSSAVLYDDPAAAPKRLAALEAAIDRKAAAMLDEAKAAYTLHAQRLNTPPVYDPAPTAEEKEAANLIVERGAQGAQGARGAGGAQGAQGGRGAGGGRGGGAAGPQLPQHMNAEFTILLGRKLSALEIRDFLAGEFEPLPLADLMAVLRAREAAGAIKLVPRPPAPVPVKKK
jgi:hypothetical protein